MNFKNGTELAKQQDEYLKRYLNGYKFTKKEIQEMESNLWVKTASVLAPSNLVVRQYALLDLMLRRPKYVEQILKQLKTLTYNTKDNIKLWAEGYSYYRYTKDILDEWCKLFPTTSSAFGINTLLNQIDKGFVETAYEKNGVLYPALFGDLRNEPLRDPYGVLYPAKQIDSKSVYIANVFMAYDKTVNSYMYIISGNPIGLNTHIPKNESVSFVIREDVIGFKFYEGYDKKYKNKMEEVGDSLNTIKSILLSKFKNKKEH